MPNRFLRILAVSIGMFAYLANVTVLGSEWILCAEPDGRVAVELVGDHAPCLPAPMVLCTGEEAGCAEHVECKEQCACGPCPCEDMPLSVELAPLTKRAQLPEWYDGRAFTGVPIPGLPTLRFDNTVICATLHANTHLSNGAQIRSLRSVVLLI